MQKDLFKSVSRVSGGKNIAVGEASASGASETHGHAIPQFLCAVPHSGKAQKNKRIMSMLFISNF